MPDRNVLVLGSDAFAKEVCAAINQWKMGDGAIVDKPDVATGDTEIAFTAKTVGISIFRAVEKIDLFVLVATGATVENDGRIYERLKRWGKKIIVISDTDFEFAVVDISIPEHGILTSEDVRSLFRAITGRSGVVDPGPGFRYRKLSAALAVLGVVTLLYCYTHPGAEPKTLEFEKVTIYIEFPRSLESGEPGTLKMTARRNPGAPLADVKVVLKSDDITWEDKEGARNFVDIASLEEEQHKTFNCNLKASAQGKEMNTTLKVYLGDVEVFVLDDKRDDANRFTVRKRPVPFQRFTPSAGLVSLVLAFVSAPWKRWFKKI